MKNTHIVAAVLLSTLSLYAQNPQANTAHHASHATINILGSMHTPMMKMPLSKSGNIDQNFLADMMPHYQGTIDSTKLVLTQGENQQILTLAQGIINAQEKEIS